MKVDYINQTKNDSKRDKRVDYKQKIGKKWIALITLLLFSMQMAWAQVFTKDDLAKTEICNFQDGTVSYTIPSNKISESTQCAWTVKVGEEVTTEGVTVSDDGDGEKHNKLTLKLSQKTRSVEVSYTDAESNQLKISFDVEPKVYGKTYNGENNTKVNFYAEKYAEGEGSKEKPYIISNDLELAKLAYDVTNGKELQVLSGTYFKLSQDIDLSKGIWMPIGSWNTTTQHFFAGKFNGDGHAIRNMLIQWTNVSGKEASWGLFSRLNGKGNNEAGYASVTNLLIENACIEKKKDYVPIGSSVIKLGILAADMTQNAEIGNIIIRNSKVTDHGEAYKTINNYRVGGVVGYLNNNFSLRIYNISADTEMNMHTQATLNPSASIKGQVTISGGFGAASRLLNAGYAILPRNIYIHGPQMKTNSDTKKCYRGTVMAFIAADNFVSKVNDTWYYTPVNKVSEPNDFNNGSEKEIDAVNQTTGKTFGSTFAEQNNEYIKEMDGMKTWAYSNSNKQFSFNSIKIKYERGTEDKLTVVDEDGTDSSEKYDWYVSKDNATWKKANTTEACNPFILPRQEYGQYVYATVGSSRTNTIQVKAIHVEASLSANSTNGITYTVNVTNDTEEKFTNEELGLKITYQWYKGENKLPETKASYTRPKDATHKDKFRCFVTVEISPDYTFSKWVNATTVVYLKPATSLSDEIKKQEEDNIKDAEYGYSADKPMLTWKGAYSKLSDKASWDENVIVLMGKSNTSITNDQTYGFNITPNNIRKQILTGEMWSKAKKSPLFKNVTITGKYNQTEYKNACIEITSLDMGLPIWKDTRFEHVTFNNEGTGDDTYKNIFCQYNNLEMGEGIRMTGFNKNSTNYGTIDGAVTTPMQIFGGFSNDGRFYPLNNKDSIAAFNRSMPHGKEGFSITIKSGFYSAICVGGRQTITKNDKGEQLNGVMGTPTQPIKCTITMDIDRKWNDDNNQKRTIDGAERTNDYDAGIILAGNHEGAMYADVDIIIRSGKVARIVNGTLGAQSEFTLNYEGEEYKVPLNTFMGRANILLDPAKSAYKKIDDFKDDNERVVVTELYGGSMGRGHTSAVKINNPFYGYSTITINGGTFKILPEGNTEKDKILCGIFGAGAGGMNGIGTDAHHTPDERIAYWSSKDVMLYGPYDKAKKNLISYTCYNADEHQNAPPVKPQDTNTKIIINGGIFGSSDKMIDGIYAGGSGYMSRGLWTSNDATPSTTGGNVYGSKEGTAVSLTINGGTFYCKNGIYAGGRGTDWYYSEKHYGGKASDYTALGQTYGNVELKINGGNFYCPVFGGGYGVADAKLKDTNTITTLSDMARIYGKSNVTIYGGIFYQDTMEVAIWRW